MHILVREGARMSMVESIANIEAVRNDRVNEVVGGAWLFESTGIEAIHDSRGGCIAHPDYATAGQSQPPPLAGHRFPRRITTHHADQKRLTHTPVLRVGIRQVRASQKESDPGRL